MDSCNFTNGGQISISAPNVTVTNCIFVNNVVDSSGYSPGGALLVTSQDFDTGDADYFSGAYSLANCSFTNNSNVVHGGSSEGAPMDQGDVGFGGAVMISGSQGSASETFIMQQCHFVNNSAVSGGGIGTFGVANVLMSECEFEQNFASSGGGAAIFSYGLQPRLTSAYLERSVINNSRFASPNTPNCDVMFQSCRCAGARFTQITNSLGTGLCIVDVDGGQCGSSSTLTATSDSPSELNEAFDAYDISTDDISSSDNSEESSFVGSLNLVNSIVVDVRDCAFVNHTCLPQASVDPFLGGAGLRLESCGLSVLTRLVFDNNYARQGAGLHMKACDRTLLWNSSFVNNTVSHEGGAIAFVDTGETGLLIGATNMTDCSALSGGAVFGGPGTTIAITNGSRLTGNTAVTDGGAVYCNGCQSFALRGSTEVGKNQAEGSGGGCHFDACLLLNLTSISVHDNRSDLIIHSCVLGLSRPVLCFPVLLHAFLVMCYVAVMRIMLCCALLVPAAFVLLSDDQLWTS